MEKPDNTICDKLKLDQLPNTTMVWVIILMYIDYVNKYNNGAYDIDSTLTFTGFLEIVNQCNHDYSLLKVFVEAEAADSKEQEMVLYLLHEVNEKLIKIKDLPRKIVKSKNQQ
jgi:hypothetical protein